MCRKTGRRRWEAGRAVETLTTGALHDRNTAVSCEGVRKCISCSGWWTAWENDISWRWAGVEWPGVGPGADTDSKLLFVSHQMQCTILNTSAWGGWEKSSFIYNESCKRTIGWRSMSERIMSSDGERCIWNRETVTWSEIEQLIEDQKCLFIINHCFCSAFTLWEDGEYEVSHYNMSIFNQLGRLPALSFVYLYMVYLADSPCWIIHKEL